MSLDIRCWNCACVTEEKRQFICPVWVKERDNGWLSRVCFEEGLRKNCVYRRQAALMGQPGK